MKISIYKTFLLLLVYVLYSIEGHSQNQNCDSLKKVLQTQKEDTNKANTLNRLGLFYRDQGDYSEALKHFDYALKIQEESKNDPGIARAYMSIADAYFQQENYPEALKNCYKALNLYEKREDKRGIAYSLEYISNANYYQDNFSEAFSNASASLKIYEEIEDRYAIARLYNMIGSNYSNQGKYDEALQKYFTALKIFEEFNAKVAIAWTYMIIGEVYQMQGDITKAKGAEETSISKYSEALKNYTTALKIRSNLRGQPFLDESYQCAGTMYVRLKKFSLAKDYFEKSLLLSGKTGNKTSIHYLYLALSELDSIHGNYKGAYEHYKMHILYRDSVINEENKKKSLQAQMQYDFDKKESLTKAEHDKKDALANAEIKRQTLIRNSTFGGVGIVGIFAFFLVRSVSRRRKTSFEKQVSQVEMKALRSQMNPHFIFNSLNSIHSFIQQNKGEKASDYLIKFSRLMRLILENSNHEEVPLESDLEALGLYMELEAARMNNKFTFSIDVADDIDIENTMVPPLILQPFVENSIWHGMMHKEESGLIKINVSKSGDMVKCTVEDNGVGREKAKELKSSTQKGKHESLGMKITNERIAIINRIKKSKAFVALKDLHDDAKRPLGTLVEVQLPLETGF